MRSRRSSPPEPGLQLGFAWQAPGLVAGGDEAGRGPLAGPVVAAAVILDELRPVRGLADSKQLTARRRAQLAPLLRDASDRRLLAAVEAAVVLGFARLGLRPMQVESAKDDSIDACTTTVHAGITEAA